MEVGYLIYFASITVVAGITLLLVSGIIKRTEKKRLIRVRNIAPVSAVETDSPVDDPYEIKHAEQSVGGRFSIIRKISIVIVILIWFLMAVFPFLGMVPVTFISIVVSAFGIVIGIAARPVIENVIAGTMISFSKLFRIGDTVFIDDQYGTIEDISMTHTMVKIWDWRRYVIPNSNMLTKDIINYTINDPYIWAYVEFFVAYDADLEAVEKAAIKIAQKSIKSRAFEEPRFWPMEFKENSIKCWVCAWAGSAAEAWTLRTEIRYGLVKELHSMGVLTHINNVSFKKDDGVHGYK